MASGLESFIEGTGLRVTIETEMTPEISVDTSGGGGGLAPFLKPTVKVYASDGTLLSESSPYGKPDPMMRVIKISVVVAGLFALIYLVKRA